MTGQTGYSSDCQSQPHILIVDDSLENLSLLAKTLSDQGYDIRKAISGSMALMGIQAAPPDLILLDIRLPDISGYSFCQQLKAAPETCHIPIIFLSALDSIGDKAKAFEVGGVDYITKPFDPQEVVLRVQNQLALQAAKAEIEQLNQTLEQRVEERTAALTAANQALLHEIRVRQAVEQTLQDSEARLSSILNSLEEVVWSTAVDKSYMIYLNPVAEAVYGYPVEAFFDNPNLWFEVIHPDDQVRTKQIFAQIGVENPCGEAIYRIIRPDGTIRWLRDRGYLICDVDGNPLRRDGVVQDITVHIQAEQLLRQQAKQTKLVADIGQRIRQSLDLETILQTTVTEIRQFLQIERVLIYRFHADWSGTVIVESVMQSQFSALGRTITDHCFAQRYVEQYQQGRIQSIQDVYQANLTPCHVELLESFGVRANLVVPIVFDQQLWGLLLANQCSEPRPWPEMEIELLKQLASQVAIAIQQSQLYGHVQEFNQKLEQQVQERTAQLQQARQFDALLKRITDNVRDSLDEQQIMQAVVKDLAIGLDAQTCDTAFYDLERQESRVRYEYATVEVPTGVNQIWPMSGRKDVYAQLLQRQWVQFVDFHPVRGEITFLACPIFDDQGILGDLWLTRPKNQIFTQPEIQLAQQVANQCAIAIRQARLFAAAQMQVEALEQLNQLKDDFLSTVSHELRSPITNMKMALQMLNLTLRQLVMTHLSPQDAIDSTRVDAPNPTNGKSHTATPAHSHVNSHPESALDLDLSAHPESLVRRIAQYLKILNAECQQEINLVNDLLDLQRLEANRQPLELAEVDLNLLLPTLADSFQGHINARQLRLEVAIPQPLPMIESNQDGISRIVGELLHNACKYTPPHEQIQLVAILPQHSNQLDQLQITVCNTGASIPTQELPHIFEKFYRVPSTDRWQQGGTGLGLALVRELVHHLGGEIQVESCDRKTAFTVTLPIAPNLQLSHDSIRSAVY
ncbi:MAG: GAF domain-containing protein [Thainema sp.]